MISEKLTLEVELDRKKAEVKDYVRDLSRYKGTIETFHLGQFYAILYVFAQRLAKFAII